MSEITIEGVDAKLAKGEKLTAEETKFVMSGLPEDGGAGNKPTPEEEEEIEFPDVAEDADKGKEKENETDEEKTAREAKEAEDTKKKEEETKAAEDLKKKEAEEKDPFVKIETELAKPEGQENLEGFTAREKAYFHQMKRDRKNRQTAEEERDAAKFRELQRKNQEEAAKKVTEEEDPLKELKEKDPEEFMTVADVVKILEKVNKKPAPKEAAKRQGVDPVAMKYLQFCDKEARAAHPDDYDIAMELQNEIVAGNSEYLLQIQEAIHKGENPAEKTYELIKNDPEFAKLAPAADAKVKGRKANEKKSEKTPEQIEKERKAKETEDAIEKNKNKAKTTGHGGGEGGGADESEKIDGYSIDDIMNMSDLTFAKLPKKTREAFLKTHG